MHIKDRVKQGIRNSPGAWWTEHSVWVEKRQSLIHPTKAVVGVSVEKMTHAYIGFNKCIQTKHPGEHWDMTHPLHLMELAMLCPTAYARRPGKKIDAKYNRNRKCRYDGVRPYCHISYECDLKKTSICQEPVMSWYFNMFDLVLIRNFTFQ